MTLSVFDQNICKVIPMHAYSLIAVFSMVDDRDTKITHDMMLIRNSHGGTKYQGEWAPRSFRWSYKMKKQVPFGYDPTNAKNTGVFAVPKKTLGLCFHQTTIAHFRDDEGYVHKWFDFEDRPLEVAKDSTSQKFYFTPTSNKDDLYVSLHLYSTLKPSVDQENDFIDNCMTGQFTWNEHQAFLDGTKNMITE